MKILMIFMNWYGVNPGYTFKLKKQSGKKAYLWPAKFHVRNIYMYSNIYIQIYIYMKIYMYLILYAELKYTKDKTDFKEIHYR